MKHDQPKSPSKPRKAQEKQLKPWDRRPWPKSGDSEENKLYTAVGRALSAWEKYEAELAFLFSQFVTTNPFLIRPSVRAYCAVRTFYGRSEMLQAASLAFFSGWGIADDQRVVRTFKETLTNARKFNERRNDIAHGVVDHYHPENITSRLQIDQNTYGLFPAYGIPKDRDQAGLPSYCYTSTEVAYFTEHFLGLAPPAHNLAAEISVLSATLIEHGTRHVRSSPRKSQ